MTTPTTEIATTDPPATPAAVLALSPGYSDTAAAGAISWALTQVESYCQRRFAHRDSTVTVTAHCGAALLPDPPITSVVKVESLVRWPIGSMAPLDWHELDLGSYYWSENGEIADGRAYVGADVPWSAVRNGIRVTYSHGFEFWPQAVIDSVVALAAAYIVNPAGMSERRVLDVTNRWMPGVGAAGVVDPFAGLADYVLREVA